MFIGFRRWSIMLLTGMMAAALGGCAGASEQSSGASDSARAEIVVADYPLQYVVEQLTDLPVANLTAPGVEPHDLELTPQQVRQVQEASLVVYQSGFQAAVDDAVAQVRPDGPSVDASASFEPLTTSDGVDPHFWLSPKNLIPVAQAVAAQLSDADSEAAKLQAFTDRMNKLDADLRDGLADCQRQTFVTTHAAFGYLARDYGLEQVAIAGLDPNNEPSAARLAEVRATAEKTGVTTIFYETLASDAVAKSLADDLGLATDVLDPVEGVTSASRGDDYAEIMEANLAALRKANGCR
ncbi:MAG: metal ABC transporter substrate-binding protein [Propionibacteriaceae bacterium]|nr:metal ABC transporter substrate-binding protein [Propionibacteriaceae bacterium]